MDTGLKSDIDVNGLPITGMSWSSSPREDSPVATLPAPRPPSRAHPSAGNTRASVDDTLGSSAAKPVRIPSEIASSEDEDDDNDDGTPATDVEYLDPKTVQVIDVLSRMLTTKSASVMVPYKFFPDLWLANNQNVKESLLARMWHRGGLQSFYALWRTTYEADKGHTADDTLTVKMMDDMKPDVVDRIAKSLSRIAPHQSITAVLAQVEAGKGRYMAGRKLPEALKLPTQWGMYKEPTTPVFEWAQLKKRPRYSVADDLIVTADRPVKHEATARARAFSSVLSQSEEVYHDSMFAMESSRLSRAEENMRVRSRMPASPSPRQHRSSVSAAGDATPSYEFSCVNTSRLRSLFRPIIVQQIKCRASNGATTVFVSISKVDSSLDDALLEVPLTPTGAAFVASQAFGQFVHRDPDTQNWVILQPSGVKITVPSEIFLEGMLEEGLRMLVEPTLMEAVLNSEKAQKRVGGFIPSVTLALVADGVSLLKLTMEGSRARTIWKNLTDEGK